MNADYCRRRAPFCREQMRRCALVWRSASKEERHKYAAEYLALAIIWRDLARQYERRAR